MTARCHPVSLPGDTEDTDTREKIRIWIHPGKTLKLHLPKGYDMGATSTTDVEPLSDHGPTTGAADRCRPRGTAARFATFLSSQTVVDHSILNPASHKLLLLVVTATRTAASRLGSLATVNPAPFTS